MEKLPSCLLLTCVVLVMSVLIFRLAALLSEFVQFVAHGGVLLSGFKQKQSAQPFTLERFAYNVRLA